MDKPTDIKSDSVSADDSASELYQAISAERVPPQLDRFVLKLATREVNKDTRFSWFIPWLRPMAFAATAGLSLAVLLEINDSSDATNGIVKDGTEIATSAEVLDEFASAAADSSSRIREIGETAAERELDGESTVNVYTGSESLDTSLFCDDKESATAEAWQRCIELLHADGRTREADSELVRFRKVYPASSFRKE